MEIEALNSGLIYTNNLCIGCNKCISGCPSVGANVVIKQEESEQYRVEVHPHKCILCGHCIDECVHHARTYKDDTEDFFKALSQGENITILVAPSLLTDYEEDYNNILGYLKNLGANHIYNTSFGADIMVWAYVNLINSFGLSGVISPFCPVIVNYLEKYKPELLSYLLPVQSPMMCTAIYVSDYLKNPDKLAYISPCVAGKYEIDDVNTYKKVSYNVTFERLMEHIKTIDISSFHAEDEVNYGLGVLISNASGLSDNMKLYIGFNEVLIQTTGYRNIFPYFDHYYKEVSSGEELPFLVDALSCVNGCNFGTGTCCGVERRNKTTFAAHRAKERAYKSGNVPNEVSYEERLSTLNKRFEDFELSSFVRQYDMTRAVELIDISPVQISAIYDSMYKFTEEQRRTDCGACGYTTCKQMAHAIALNINHKENCIVYTKECVRLQTEKTEGLLSEISNMNGELKISAQLKSNFLANMSHEIRTPMNAVIGMAEMALRGELPSQERGYIQQIKSSGRSLLAIINDILDFSKIESGKMELNESEYEAMSIINDTVNIVMTRIGEKDLTLMVNADPNIPSLLYGDDIRIKQVLVNFANNAVKFTNSGCVEISMTQEVSSTGLYLKISVRDTGMGIKQEDLAKLFNSFQQIDSKRNRNIEGTGLGLAISRELVNIMNGEISVESVYGSGSTFSFKIPQTILDSTPSIIIPDSPLIKTASFIDNLYVKEGFLNAIISLNVENVQCSCLEDLQLVVQNDIEFLFIDYLLLNPQTDAFIQSLHIHNVQVVLIVDPRKDIVSKPYLQKLNQPLYSYNVAAVLNHQINAFERDSPNEGFKFKAPDAKILIVDDNAINLTVAVGLLSPMSMQIKTASSAIEALAFLENELFDLVFMDHMMPDIDGVEATHMIRAKDGEYFKTLPIIALTANAINNAKEMFLKEGMNDFVAKPIEMVDIISKLKKWLPSEKINAVSTSDSDYLNTKHLSLEDAEFLEIQNLDVKAGLAISGTLVLYKSILSDYYSVIEKKANLIEQYFLDENIEAYTIEVHGLKSSSKLIGATDLSNLAAHLEKAGHNKNWDPIKSDTDRLIKLYRSYIPILAPYYIAPASSSENKISVEDLKEKLSLLVEVLDNFDIDTALSISTELQSCLFSNEITEMILRLTQEISVMEYDSAAAIANSILGEL